MFARGYIGRQLQGGGAFGEDDRDQFDGFDLNGAIVAFRGFDRDLVVESV